MSQDEAVGAGTPTHRDDPVENAGGSAEPGAAGPGSGTPAPASAAGEVGSAAIAAVDSFSGAALDAGVGAADDVLQIANVLNTHAANIVSAVSAAIAGDATPEAAPIPTAKLAGELTGAAQSAANRVLDEAQRLSNVVFDLIEKDLQEALRIADAFQARAASLFSRAASHVNVGPPKG